MTRGKLELVLCWHMHQPQYRDARGERWLKPWTWLHAIKDYTDMAAHLETVPGMKAVVNFSTILLEQVVDLAERIERRVAAGHPVGRPIGDPLLDALAGDEPQTDEARLALAAACLHANRTHMIAAFPPYAALAEATRHALATGVPLPTADLHDLLAWYVLAWTGESVRREHALVRELMHRGRGFSPEERRALLELTGRLLAGVLPRYRQLAERGIVELSLTPHAHPLLPLLIDPRAAREALPEAPLPSRRHPHGRERCAWHLARALDLFERRFGRRPQGCWPSEGGLSEDALALLARSGFAWTATGTNVLRNSLGRGHEGAHFRPWRATRGDASIACFFRDDALSDRIGFEYATWDAGHAVDDFIARLEALRREWTEPEPPLVAIVMDGENAWEHYPYNAWYFLQHLYSKLVQHEGIELTTFGAVAARAGAELPCLTAGSWVHGNFAVWIGDAEKNRAWELLAEAAERVEQALATGVLSEPEHAAVLEQLAVCEGSDWFWWLGGDNDPRVSAEFDAMFRAQLAGLFELLREAPPESLAVPIVTRSGSAEAGGSMRRANA